MFAVFTLLSRSERRQDDSAGLQQYVDCVLEQCPADSGRPVVVAHSFGGFTGASTSLRLDTRELIYVSGMVPQVGERPGQWWDHTGCVQAQIAAANAGGYNINDMTALFYNDVDPHIVADEFRAGNLMPRPKMSGRERLCRRSEHDSSFSATTGSSRGNSCAA